VREYVELEQRNKIRSWDDAASSVLMKQTQLRTPAAYVEEYPRRA